MSKTPEVLLKEKIIKYMKDKGHLIVTAFGDGHMPNGFPDKFGVLSSPKHLRGKFYAFEVKVPGKKPKPNQLQWLQWIEDHGGLCAWVNSVEGVQDCLDEWAL